MKIPVNAKHINSAIALNRISADQTVILPVQDGDTPWSMTGNMDDFQLAIPEIRYIAVIYRAKVPGATIEVVIHYSFRRMHEEGRKEPVAGNVVRVGVEGLTGAGFPAARTPGEVVASGVRSAWRELTFAEVAARQAVRLQDAEVKDSLATVSRLAQGLVRERLRLACEVAERGLHTESGHRLPDWLVIVCPDLEGAVRHDTCRLAVAST